jgi:hypothetical protein
MLMNRGEGEEFRPPRWELEDSSFDEVSVMLTEEPITRARAIKLAGAAILSAAGMMALGQSPAEARKKHRRHRKKKKKVTAAPQNLAFPDTPVGDSSTETVAITNNGTEPVYVQPQLGNGFTLAPSVDASAPISPGTTGVDVVFTPLQEGAYEGELTIVDSSGTDATAVDLTGTGVSA